MQTGSITNIRIKKAAKGEKGKPCFPVGIASNCLYRRNHGAMKLSFPERANGTAFPINEMEMIRMCLLWEAG
jgi:hypothetical protein